MTLFSRIGQNCDHWRTECTKCGRRYHICDSTSQCESCRTEYYRDGKFLFYRDTRHPGETRIDKLSAACVDLRYLGRVGDDLAGVKDELFRLRPDLLEAAYRNTHPSQDSRS